MKTVALTLTATFFSVQLIPAALATPIAPSTHDMSHAKCKKGEKMDEKTKKCVKAPS